MIYGYARCSTNDTKQDIERQVDELLSMGVTNKRYIYSEYESGTKTDRKELAELLSVVREGDTIVTTEVSRLSRSTKQLIEIIDLVRERHLKLVIGNFVVDCTESEIDPMTKGMLMLLSVFAEMERDMIRQRVKSGLEHAKRNGKSLGRKTFQKKDIPDAFYRYYPAYKNGQYTITELSRLLECSRNTIYRYIEYAELPDDKERE